MRGVFRPWRRSRSDGTRDTGDAKRGGDRRRVIVSAHDGYPRWVNSGANFIEIDIRRSPNGVIVLAHDELKPGRRYVPFKEIVDAACGRIGMHLDLKEAGYEVELIRMALEKCPADKLVLTSEDPYSVRIVKEQFPEVRTGITAKDVKATNADFAPIDQQRASEEALDFCARNQIPVWVWTVDDERLMKRFIDDERIEGIITNRPDRALKLLRVRA
jgi:glycerophosphoryl diester phosphodiesterase